MTRDDKAVTQVDELLAATDMADALESEHFRRFLDKIPIATAVSELKQRERVVYANPEFARLTGIAPADIEGKDWSALRAVRQSQEGQPDLGTIIAASHEEPEEFCLSATGEPPVVDVHSHVIENDDGVHTFRLAALV